MYNCLEDKNLNEIYNYLVQNDMFDLFIKAIVEENELYKKMINDIKEQKKDEKQDN